MPVPRPAGPSSQATYESGDWPDAAWLLAHWLWLASARKYSPHGGTIRVRAEGVAGAVQVSISDSGLGLPPEALPHLFEKLYRVDNSDRRQIRGTGLGLAIAREIREQHGGRSWAASEGVGRGSTFHFTLPTPDTLAA